MSLWDDFWEGFFGGFALGAATAQAGAATGFAIGSLGGETAAKAGAAFGASVGGQIFSGAARTQDVPYSGLPTESPVAPEQQQQLGQQAAAADQEQVWAYQTTGEVIGPAIDLDTPEQSTGSMQWTVSPEQSQQWGANGTAEQQSQSYQLDYQELRAFQDVLRSDYSREYLARVIPVVKEIGPPRPPGAIAELPPGAIDELPHIVDSAPPPLLSPPSSPSPAPPGPSLLDELARTYGGDIHTPDTYTPSIDEIVYDTGTAADPPAQYAGGVDVEVSMGSFGSVPVPDSFLSQPTLGSYWTDAHAFLESQLPAKGTWQRGFVRALGESALSAQPLYRVYALWSSAYDLTQKPGDLGIGGVYVWWQANTNPVMGTLSNIVDFGMAADSDNDEEVARNATHLLLMLVGMLLGARAGGGGAGRKGGGGPLLEGEAGAGVGEGLGEAGAGEGAGQGAGEAGLGEGAGQGAGEAGLGEGAGQGAGASGAGEGVGKGAGEGGASEGTAAGEGSGARDSGGGRGTPGGGERSGLFTKPETLGLNKLFGRGPKDARAVIHRLDAGEQVPLPGGVTRGTLLRYRELAQNLIDAGLDKRIGTQKVRVELIDKFLSK